MRSTDMDAIRAASEMTRSVPPLLSAQRSKANLLVGGFLAACAFLGMALLFFFDPAQYGFYPQCILHRTTGVLCPGCGSLRAVHHLLHGEILAAVRFNALLVVLMPVAAAFMLRSWAIARSPEANRIRVPQAHLWCVLALTIVFGVLRNTPLARTIGLIP